MNKINFSITITTLGFFFYTVLCAMNFSLVFLSSCLLLLFFALVWMVLTILKNGEPPKETFDERFYEDAPHLGPGKP